MRTIREILRLFPQMIDALFISENLFLTYLDPLSRFIATAEFSKINILIFYRSSVSITPIYLFSVSSPSIPYILYICFLPKLSFNTDNMHFSTGTYLAILSVVLAPVSAWEGKLN